MSGGNDPGVDDPVQFFKKTSASAIARVLKRADRNAAKEARRQQNLIRSALQPRRTFMGKALGLALAHHGRSGKGRTSIRQTAPDTGGRPYHFGYSSVTKGESARGGKGKAAAGSAGSSDAGTGAGASAGGGRTARKGRSAGSSRAGATIGGKPRSREAAHQNYTERAAALDKDPVGIQQAIREAERERAAERERESEPDGPAQDTGRERDRDHDGPERGMEASRSLVTIERAEPGREQDQDREGPQRTAGAESVGRDLDVGLSQDWVEREIGRAPGLSDRHGEAAAQAYIENPDKTVRLHGTTASFGTIGETFEERLEFWDLVHRHESKDGRTQSRLVVELPHEANGRARHEIVRRFTNDLLERGIPFWASIHAPTKQNDHRNHHAHIVFIDRPASRMAHPETGEEVWDFTVAVKIRKASRNTILSYPYRQNRDPGMRDRGHIKRSRARFSEITNEVMREHGVGVRYDPRSYKDMGLDVAPMNHVSRILADKTRSQAFVVMDPEWTRKMIKEEMKAAAIRRDETYQALRATEDRLREVTRTLQNTASANRVLPREMRLSPGHRLTQAVGNRLVRAWTEAERDRLAGKFVDEVTIRTLGHVIDATTPKAGAKGPARVHAGGQAPDAEDLRHLNDAAREELAAYRLQVASRRLFHRERLKSVSEEWQTESSGGAQPRRPQARRAGPSPEGPSTDRTATPRPTAGAREPVGRPTEGRGHVPTEHQETARTASPRATAPGREAAPTPPPARRGRPSPQRTPEGAAQIEAGLEWARRKATGMMERIIREARSPQDVADMAKALLTRTPAENAYAEAMGRMRQRARDQLRSEKAEPTVRIVSMGEMRDVADRRPQAPAPDPTQAAPIPARERPGAMAQEPGRPAAVAPGAAAANPPAIGTPGSGRRGTTMPPTSEPQRAAPGKAEGNGEPSTAREPPSRTEGSRAPVSRDGFKLRDPAGVRRRSPGREVDAGAADLGGGTAAGPTPRTEPPARSMEAAVAKPPEQDATPGAAKPGTETQFGQGRPSPGGATTEQAAGRQASRKHPPKAAAICISDGRVAQAA